VAEVLEGLAVEDSLRGLESARRAGIDCAVVRHPFTASQRFDAAWRFLDSVRDLPRVLRE
jgi:beta-phosphoglucomutase-like phosphatase (HAD superfamily)